MPQHGGERFGIHAVLQHDGGEGMPQIVEPHIGVNAGPFQQFFVDTPHRAGIVHIAGLGGREHVFVVGALFVLLPENRYGLGISFITVSVLSAPSFCGILGV